MDKIVHLSLTKKDVPKRIDVVQYATTPSIIFVLDDYTPTGTASLYIQKPDGTKIYNACTISGNQVTYKPTTQSPSFHQPRHKIQSHSSPPPAH